ncbi:MAG: ribokinase [Sedimentisphaerales bacterium]|nr:ribokinase [Sedimentisphaerales bacterium]
MAQAVPHVVVIGSAFVDIAIRCTEIPGPGETVTGTGFSCLTTGAGVNQATEASLCGCTVYFIGKVGSDFFGEMIRKSLASYKIKCDYVVAAEAKNTGAIVTMVNAAGENGSCISLGANRAFRAADIEAAENVIAAADACLIHGDIPQEAVVAAVRMANLHKVKVLLDPALGVNGNSRKQAELPMEYFSVNVLIVNAEEASEIAQEPLSDIHKAKLVGSDLVARGAQNVVIKMGRKGCLIVNREGTEHIPPFEVDMVDKTCAGDAFAGALAASCAVGDSIKQAVRFAAAAGALAYAKFGSQESLPKKSDILELLHKQS